MYNYEKALPKGYEIERKIVMGSSAEVFILINSKGNRIVSKISDVEGINRNGKDNLRNEINFLEYFHRTRTMDISPKIYNYEANNLYVYYDMAFIKGTCGLYQIQDDAKYTIDGRNTQELMNNQIKEIIQFIKRKDREIE